MEPFFPMNFISPVPNVDNSLQLPGPQSNVTAEFFGLMI